MRILLLSQRYHPFVGGVETQTRLLAHELAAEHHVEVAAMNFTVSELPKRVAMLHQDLLVPSYESYEDGPVSVHSLTPTWAERLQMLPIAARAVPRLRRYAYHALRRFGYRFYRRLYVPKLRALMRGADVVHSVAGGYLGWAAEEAARREGLPFALTPYVHPGQHGDDPDSVAFYNRTDAVFALLETDRDLLVDLGVPAEKIHLSGVVPLLPETADPGGFRRRHGLGEAPLVLYVGRLSSYKGAPTLKAAAARVWERHPEAHFFFVGPASLEEAQQVDAHDARVRYLGRVSEQEKADALAACTLFSMPSRFEILPAVYLEAWSYAKPVVGGPARGLPELIEGNGAGLTAPQEPDAVARALMDLLENDEKRQRMGAAGKALVEARFSKPALVGAISSVYEQLVQDAAPPAGARARRTPAPA